MGIFFAFVALFCWGLGDFLIQKSSRAFGKWAALFFITATAAIVLFPLVYKDIIPALSNNKQIIILLVASLVLLVAALFDFQALKDGKISVVEPIYALEIPVTAVLTSYLLLEHLTFWQKMLVISLMLGIFLVSTKSFQHLKKIKLEKGVIYAFLAAFGMGATNFLFGVGSRAINPLMINWFTSFIVAVITLIYIMFHAQRKEILGDWHRNKRLIVGVGLVDNAAWIAFSYSTLHIPIAIATGISEAYIALGAILGLLFNKETLKQHQVLGLVIAVTSAIVLAAITPG